MSTNGGASSSHAADDDDPFEDAEDDPFIAAMMRATAENTKRNSAASYIPDLAGAEIAAVRYADSRRSSMKPAAPVAVSTPGRIGAMVARNSEDDERMPTVRAVKQSTGPLPASPIVPGASNRKSIIASNANPQTPVRTNRTSVVTPAVEPGTTSAGAGRPWSATSSTSRGAPLFQTP